MDRVSCPDHLGSRWHLYYWLVFDRLKGMLHKHTYWLTDLLYVNNAPLRDTCWRGRWGALVLVMLLLSYSQLSLQLAPVSPSLPCSSQYQSQCPETNDGQQHSEICPQLAADSHLPALAHSSLGIFHQTRIFIKLLDQLCTASLSSGLCFLNFLKETNKQKAMPVHYSCSNQNISFGMRESIVHSLVSLDGSSSHWIFVRGR